MLEVGGAFEVQHGHTPQELSPGKKPAEAGCGGIGG